MGRMPGSARRMYRTGPAAEGRCARHVRALARVIGLAGLIGAAAVMLAPKQGAAQPDSSRAFQSVTIGLRGVTNANRNSFHRFWNPEPGLELGAESPFYAGEIELGIQIMPFAAREPANQPDYLSWFLYAGWGVEARVLGHGWYNGFRLGSYGMHFDTDDVIPSQRAEQELAAGLISRWRVPIGAGWSFDASARYRLVFTRRRIEHLFVAVGLGKRWAMPGWLREFLQ